MLFAMARRNGIGIALLADQTRRSIVAMLALRPRRPMDIAAELGLSRPAVSRQLRLLQEAGLIRVYRSYIDGRGLMYQLNPSATRQITAWLAGTGVGRLPPPT
jgi:DNA-binding MarR family transcriptional regulator